MLALALRWYRLDLMSFRYDQAEVLFRARETLRDGLPLTGIINSLGFRNAPGFVWALLPAAVFTPKPETASAWMGILTVSGIWPLWLIARRACPSAWWVPCLLYAVMPAHVFSGRSLWAQWLLPPMGMWALLWLLIAYDPAERIHRRYFASAAALAMLSAAASVHLAALLYVCVAVAVLTSIWLLVASPAGDSSAIETSPVARLRSTVGPGMQGEKRSRNGRFEQWGLRSHPVKKWLLVVTFGLLPLISLIPSALDYFRVRSLPPLEKPAHVQKFESLMPEPEPFAGRLRDAFAGQFEQLSSIAQVQGAWNPGESPVLRAVTTAADLLILGLIFAGIGISLVSLKSPGRSARLAGMILITGLVLPTLFAAVAVPRVNATYLALAVPIPLLMAGVSVAVAPHRLKLVLVGLLLSASVAHVWFTIAALHRIDETRFVNGTYYIPLSDQRSMAKKLASRGVSSGRLTHLSGEWFQRSYDYLFREELRASEVSRMPLWALIEDINLRRQQPVRADFVKQHAELWQGSVGAILLPSEEEAVSLTNGFYALPTDASREPAHP